MRGHRTWGLAAVVVALSLAAVPASAGVDDLPAWGKEPSPNSGFGPNALAAVDALSPTQAWAVGRFEEGSIKLPQVQRFDGSEWTLVATPEIAESELLGVDAVAADDVWMVGGYESTGEALIMHWDGSEITVVPHPNPGTFNRLYDVEAVAPDDVWAVGEFASGVSRPLALHWDGSAWSQVATPTGNGYNRLLGVATVASDDVWAVGEDGSRTLSLHWNGSTWTRVHTPSPESSASLRAVDASSARNVWAVGDSGDDSVTMRWTGQRWKLEPAPDPGANFLDLNGVATTAPNDAWAVGFYDVLGDWKTLTMRWNGKKWRVVDSPSPDPALNELTSVSAVSKRVAFAVGWGFSQGTLALRWRNDAWTRLTSENAGVGSNVLKGISAAAPDDIWAVGNAQSRSLTVRYDGSDWRIVPSPNLEFGVRLEDVEAIDADDAWAVGWTGSGSDLDNRNVAMHWNGHAWDIVPTPQPGGQYIDELRAIAAVSSNDVWAAGLYQDAQIRDRSLILHWNGSAWNVVPNTCDTLKGLKGITVVAPNDIWAVGEQTTCHYDGSAWTEVPSPQPRIEFRELAYPLEGVSAAAPNDVWAVGARAIEFFETVVFSAFAEHWNGSEWTRVTDIPGQFLYGVEAVSSNDVWAVGTSGFGPIIVRYDGSEWTTAPTPEADEGGDLGGIDRVGGELWAAGTYYPSDAGSRTLILNAPSEREGAVVGSSNVGDATVSWFGPEDGTIETDSFGDYQIGGLLAGTYLFTFGYQGCTPESAEVTVLAGETIRQNFELDC
jgi:hypothetical protein